MWRRKGREPMWCLDRRRYHRASRTLALVFLVPLFLCSWLGCSPKPTADDDEALMKAGVEALHTRHDPETAIADFRKVLEHTPDHYGATFQLAAALEAAGRRDEATPPVGEDAPDGGSQRGHRNRRQGARPAAQHPIGAQPI